jgi:hypothetical protein
MVGGNLSLSNFAGKKSTTLDLCAQKDSAGATVN